MDSDRWQQIDRVFDAVLDVEPSEREEALEAMCGEDAALRREVEALLQADDAAPSFLEGKAADLATSLIEEDDAEALVLEPGTHVGPYRLIRELGHGGMSVVYLAERDDGQYERQVALKVLPRAFETPDRIARFRSERQILASLDHPCIAQLLDGGVTMSGRPYLVMEYVEGVPISTYCREHGCSVDERVKLLQDVCTAVEHAHRRLVVHRDLKPSNIYVVDTADGPRVKLLDFGIAKLLDDNASWTRPVTRTGEHWMTPDYAAPEQVRNDDITTATDVYQLGVLAYELIAGERPFHVEGQSMTHIERAVLHNEPTRPSDVVERSETSTVPPRAVRGDLDTIILKALRKEPEQRYPSADDLADDLGRYRDGRPVEARPATLSYRLRSFLRRNRGGVLTGILVATLLIGYAVTVTIQNQRIGAERDRAEAVTEFMVDLFEETDPLLRSSRTLTVQEVLRRGALQVQTDMNDQPAVQAELMSVLGTIYTNLGQYPEANEMLREAIDVYQNQIDAQSPLMRTDMQTQLAYSLFRQGRYDRAETLYRDALATLNNLPGTHERIINVKVRLALLLDEIGEFDDAERLYRQALTTARRVRGEKQSPDILHNLATTLQNQGEFDRSLEMHRDALRIYRQRHGDEHPSIANVLSLMALTYQRMGEVGKAEHLQRESLRMRRKLLPSGHPHIASSLVRLSLLLVEQQRYDEAELLAVQGTAILRRILPADHWQRAAAEGVLGVCYANDGRVDEGLNLLRGSVRTLRNTLGPDDWRTRDAVEALRQIEARIDGSPTAGASRSAATTS